MNILTKVRFFRNSKVWVHWAHCLGKWWAIFWNHGTMTWAHHKSEGLNMYEWKRLNMKTNNCLCVFQALFDYEVDSDDEWEEEDPGESVSSDEVRLTEKYAAQTLFIQDKVKISVCPGTSKKQVKCNSVLTEQLRYYHRERSGSVVECLTRDQGAAASSLTDVTVLCPWARTLILF